jgi:hypothetical protein
LATGQCPGHPDRQPPPHHHRGQRGLGDDGNSGRRAGRSPMSSPSTARPAWGIPVPGPTRCWHCSATSAAGYGPRTDPPRMTSGWVADAYRPATHAMRGTLKS